jgi:hypothetical protein
MLSKPEVPGGKGEKGAHVMIEIFGMKGCGNYV